jgi:nucleoside-diphosphate-sugar epimerase
MGRKILVTLMSVLLFAFVVEGVGVAETVVLTSRSLRSRTTMRILFAGATGVLGRATAPHLQQHEVAGLTRSENKLQSLRELGAQPFLCDVYDYEALLRVARRFRPHTVANFLTALSNGSAEANSRIRREGGGNLLNAAEAVGAGRLVVESVAFPLEGDSAVAVDDLEQSTREFKGEPVILRFGRLWGPGTSYSVPARPPTIHIDHAGARAARLLVQATPGTHLVTEQEV